MAMGLPFGYVYVHPFFRQCVVGNLLVKGHADRNYALLVGISRKYKLSIFELLVQQFKLPLRPTANQIHTEDRKFDSKMSQQLALFWRKRFSLLA